MATATIAANFHQTLDVQGFLTAEVTFYFIFVIQELTKLCDFSFRQVTDTGIRVDPSLFQDFAGKGQANTVNIRQSIFNTLISRQIYTGDTSHYSKHLLLNLVFVYVSGFRK